jgi:hypothetical protein
VAVLYRKFVCNQSSGPQDSEQRDSSECGRQVEEENPSLLRNSSIGQSDLQEPIVKDCVSNAIRFPALGEMKRTENLGLEEQQINKAVARFARYLREERELYYPQGQPLSAEVKQFFRQYFPSGLLEQVRLVALAGQRMKNPSFYPQAREMGFTNLPNIAHTVSVTFLDALVFNERITERNLFHALVHATQVRTLGIYMFADLFVRGFLRMKTYSMVPLKAQAFELDMRFASNKAARFSVEDEIFRSLMEKKF